jgi:archaellum component FlaC
MNKKNILNNNMLLGIVIFLLIVLWWKYKIEHFQEITLHGPQDVSSSPNNIQLGPKDDLQEKVPKNDLGPPGKDGHKQAIAIQQNDTIHKIDDTLQSIKTDISRVSTGLNGVITGISYIPTRMYNNSRNMADNIAEKIDKFAEVMNGSGKDGEKAEDTILMIDQIHFDKLQDWRKNNRKLYDILVRYRSDVVYVTNVLNLYRINGNIDK